ncbi:dihydrodipicolinate reductase, family protein, partial [Vibrio parahaemolyticus EKP-028]
FVVKESSMFS